MDDIKLMPISGVFRMYFFNIVSIGGALGYAVGLDSAVTDGGAFMEASVGIGSPKKAFIITMKKVFLEGGSDIELYTANIGFRFQF